MFMANSQKEYWENITQRRSYDHPSVMAFSTPKIDLIEKYCGNLSSKSILDVGCGNGFFTVPFSFKAKKVVGVDFSEKMLSLNPHKNCLKASAEKLPFNESSFDICFCSNLLHHLEDPKKAILEMARVSKEWIVLSEPNRNNPFMFLFSFLVPEERAALKFSKDYLQNLALECGIEIKAIIIQGAIPPNKTPAFIVPILKFFDFPNPLGMYIILIGKKTSKKSSKN